MAEYRHLATVLVLCLSGILGASLAEEEADLTVTVAQSSPVIADRGSNITISCNVSHGLAALLSNSIGWLRKSRVPDLTNETVLISNKSDVLVEGYKVDIDTTNEQLSYFLLISDVENSDDGRYICQVKSLKHATVVASAHVDVVVSNAAMLKVDGRRAGARTKLTPGTHTVQCDLEGVSREKEHVKIWLGDLPLPDQHLKSVPMKTSRSGAPRYRLEQKGEAQVELKDDGKTLSCVAPNLRISENVTLMVVPKPSVHCRDVKVPRSERHVQLVCTVTHVRVNILDFRWELSYSGIQFSSTGLNERLNNTETKYTRTLKVAQWGNTQTKFTLTVVTEVGEVSDHAHVIVVDQEDDNEDDDDNDHDHDHDHDHGSGGDSNASSRLVWGQLMMMLMMMVILLQA
ncbi:uncharacterized protein LOC143293864 [Babylonia areolata]|uniref:uncharacterized protein LOC143293864 n=1 Tax=Babylonia areolata TaxID=304850 RepID=UPI003FD0D089